MILIVFQRGKEIILVMWNAAAQAQMSDSKYKPVPLATLPSTLDPAKYDVSLKTRKVQVKRLSIRARLKRE